MNIPKRIKLAHLPTPIEELKRLASKIGQSNIYIKRDDQTGSEYSGNKIRKLEFVVQEALDKGCDYLITCGGLQSNHARATAAVAAKLGIHSYLVLRGDESTPRDGNLFLDQILGADIEYITSEQYENRMDIMKKVRKRLEKSGHKGYIIPEGASNSIGTYGYFHCMKEIMKQEKELGIHFDAIVVAVGSGGTYAGLLLANEIYQRNTTIYGVNVCNDADHFQKTVKNLLEETTQRMDESLKISKDKIHILDGYVGLGYAMSRSEELTFIRELAKLEGVILDPVYTGKAMYGMVKEMEKGTFKNHKNILFIHTGGLFGLFPKKEQFEI